jgi:hypothetical protein
MKSIENCKPGTFVTVLQCAKSAEASSSQLLVCKGSGAVTESFMVHRKSNEENKEVREFGNASRLAGQVGLA